MTSQLVAMDNISSTEQSDRTIKAPVRSRQMIAGKSFLTQLAVVLAALVVWQLFSYTGTAVKAGLPSPIDSFVRLFELVVTGTYWVALGATMFSWLSAFLLSLGVGIPVGMALGRSRRGADSSKFMIDFLRTIPSLAIIPLALLLFGPTYTMVILTAWFTAVWPVLLQAMYAAEHADPVLARVAKSFRLTFKDRVRYVLAPEFLAFFWPGIRMAVTASLLVVVGAELIGGAPGLGRAIQDALLVNQQPSMFAYVLTAAFTGLGINAVLTLLQRKLLWWHPSMRKDR